MDAVSEIAEKKRFEFGANWKAFLNALDDERINQSVEALQNMLGISTLAGKTFLDVGSGSGLSSLAARKLGAQVYSFDYDPQSVACTAELKRRYFEQDGQWTVVEGNALDTKWLATLGQWDVVYSWGVLHHTGAMWEALNNVDRLVKPQGNLFIAIYNNQGGRSRRWQKIKKFYNKSGKIMRGLLLFLCGIRLWTVDLIIGAIRHGNPLYDWKHYKINRGMSKKYDLVDWVGGYPFEVASPEAVFDFYTKKGYALRKLTTMGGGLGCNQYVFQKTEN